MKKSITLAALLLVLGTSVFAAAAPAKTKSNNLMDEITFVPLKSDRGFGIKVDKLAPGKSIVMIYDNDRNPVFKDVLSKGTSGQKNYILTSLENGDYTVEVRSNDQIVKKQLHVYDEGQTKTYFFVQ
jgi:hypothetical protein